MSPVLGRDAGAVGQLGDAVVVVVAVLQAGEDADGVGVGRPLGVTAVAGDLARGRGCGECERGDDNSRGR